MIARTLRIVSCITKHLNKESGTAFPSRATIADAALIERKTVYNRMGELKGWGYLDWEERPTPSHGGRMFDHYAFTVAGRSTEELQAAIAEEIQKLRAAKAEKTSRRGGTSRQSGKCHFPPEREVETARPSGTARPDGSNTSRQDGNRNLLIPEREKERQRASIFEDLGHGVTFDGETLTHPAPFSIHIPSLQKERPEGVTPERALDKAKSTAVQWAVELENGASLERVVPQSIIGAIVQALANDHRRAQSRGASRGARSRGVPPTTNASKPLDPGQLTSGQWRAKLEGYRAIGKWAAWLGPRPDHPGFLGPKELWAELQAGAERSGV